MGCVETSDARSEEDEVDVALRVLDFGGLSGWSGQRWHLVIVVVVVARVDCVSFSLGFLGHGSHFAG